MEFTLDIERSSGFRIDSESGLLYLKEDFYSSSDQVIRVIACSSQFQNSSTEVIIQVVGKFIFNILSFEHFIEFTAKGYFKKKKSN